MFTRLRTFFKGYRITRVHSEFMAEVRVGMSWMGIDKDTKDFRTWSAAEYQKVYCYVDTLEEAIKISHRYQENKNTSKEIYEVPKPEPKFWQILKGDSK